MQRLAAITERVVVLDVVVHQRCLVERLDGKGRAPYRVGQLQPLGRACPRRSLERVVSRQRDERARALAALRHPVVSDRFVSSQRVGAWLLGADARGEPAQLRLLAKPVGGAHQMNVSLGPRLRRCCLEVDQLRHPVVIDRRAAAVARQERHRHTRNAGEQHLVERLLQHIQAGHADDRVNVPADDDLEHDRRAFRNEHLAAQVLRLRLEVGHRAGPAFSAIQPKLVIVGRAALGMLEAMRQKQQPALEVDRADLVAPELVAQTHHGETEKILSQAHVPDQSLAQLPKAVLGQGPRPVERLAEPGSLGTHLVAHGTRVGDNFEMTAVATCGFPRLSAAGGRGRPRERAGGRIGFPAFAGSPR